MGKIKKVYLNFVNFRISQLHIYLLIDQSSQRQQKMRLPLLALPFPLLLNGVASQCNIDEHHPENGGYFFSGAAGLSDATNLDSAHLQKLPNSTWAPGM